MGLLNTTIKASLPAGEYPVSLISYKEVENSNGGYIELTLALPDRTMKQNFFPSNLDYLGKTLRAQLNIQEEKSLEDILELAMTKDLFAVISYNEYGMNLAFHKPAVVSAKEVTF